jgi:hypothetical protein
MTAEIMGYFSIGRVGRTPHFKVFKEIGGEV